MALRPDLYNGGAYESNAFRAGAVAADGAHVECVCVPDVVSQPIRAVGCMGMNAGNVPESNFNESSAVPGSGAVDRSSTLRSNA